MAFTMRSTQVLSVILLFAATIGCGGADPNMPELAPVRGKVLMNGAPMAEARVTFEPTKEGGISGGVTNAEGEFELYYTASQKGAVVGSHKVKISKIEGEAGDELVPAKYNEASSLTQEVTAGGPNEFTFELEK